MLSKLDLAVVIVVLEEDFFQTFLAPFEGLLLEFIEDEVEEADVEVLVDVVGVPRKLCDLLTL